jgi:two-component system response regulator YesN
MQPVSSFSDLILDQVIVELNAHYNKKLSLKQLASKYYINTAYLGQLFIRKYDMTFHDYLAKIRMEKAAELLRTTNYSINQITEMTGISNPNYFHRLFKKYHRCTPLDYRARYKESI